MAETNKLALIPLGGLGEIGKNMMAVLCNGEIMVIDAGMMFPEDDMLGIDIVIPDFTYLIENKELVKGIVLTHGHEDHIGALPYVLKEVNVPVYGTKLTLGLVKDKLKENEVSNAKLVTIRPRDSIKLGSAFRVEFFRVSHSIPDAVGLAVHTPVGTILHTGDFKLDQTPVDGQVTDFARIAELGKKGVLVMLSDSTNVERPGYTFSERAVGDAFDEIFRNAESRIIVATFASNVHRIQQVINSAAKFGRKVAIVGRSMVNVANIAKEIGYLTVPDNIMIDIEEIGNYPHDRLTILTTGSQGEPMSALSRMAAGEHRKVEIVAGDQVIISATPIPGNEKFVSRVVNDLFKKGAKVIYEALADIHVSGHACQEELKLIHSLIKPKYFIPVHGEYRHLKQHGNLAHELGMPKENIFIMDIGNVLEITDGVAKLNGSVPSGRVLVDGLGVGDVGNIVLRDRKHLSQDGLIVVVISIESSTGELVAGPDVISRGFVYVRESEDLMEEIREISRRALLKCDERKKSDWATKKSIIRDALRDYLYEKTKRRPMILPIIMEV